VLKDDLPRFRRLLLAWYARHRRDLPWRVAPAAPRGAAPEPYHVLLSEAMLQQTQVAAVVPYFLRFLEALPTIEALARADEQVVLRLWQGLGYYSRARNLHAAARMVVGEMRGELPRSVEALLRLPGVGRYTAGAIASIAFDERAPILDGNVIRVLCRLDKVEADPRTPAVTARLWQRAEEVLPRKRVGDFNSALMELGATVCTPRGPKCLLCPVRAFCEAQAAGAAERLPLAAKPKPRPLLRRWTFCVRHGDRYLIEQRPAKGRWASMWQFPTVEAGEAIDPARSLPGVALRDVRPLGEVAHGLTHREYHFAVYTAAADRTADMPGRTWVELAGLGAYPLPRPHIRIAAMLATA